MKLLPTSHSGESGHGGNGDSGSELQDPLALGEWTQLTSFQTQEGDSSRNVADLLWYDFWV